MRFVEFYNSFVTRLLSRDLSTPVKRSQHSYQQITALLSRDLNTPVKRLQHSYQHSCQEIAASYQQITALLSRDLSTPINRLQHSYQQITAKHNKNDRILKFLSPMHFTHINFLPVHSNEKIYQSLKQWQKIT